MIEKNNPAINVSEVEALIKDEVLKNYSKKLNISDKEDFYLRITLKKNLIDTLIEGLANKIKGRKSLPPQFDFFPVNKSRGLQKLILKVMDAALKDQKAINYTFLETLKALNEENKLILKKLEEK